MGRVRERIPVIGHMPRTESLREMILKNVDDDEAENWTDEQLKLQNYQRRSPLPGVIIKRASKDNGNGDTPFGYDNIMRLVNEGEEKLEQAHLEEMKLISETK